MKKVLKIEGSLGDGYIAEVQHSLLGLFKWKKKYISATGIIWYSTKTGRWNPFTSEFIEDQMKFLRVKRHVKNWEDTNV